MEELGYLFCGLSVPYEGDNLRLAGGKVEAPYVIEEGGDKLFQVRLEEVDTRLLHRVEPALLQFLHVGENKLLDVQEKPLLQLPLVFLPVLQQDLERRIRLFEAPRLDLQGLLRPLPLRDVLYRALVVEDPAALIADELGIDRDPGKGAVFPVYRELEIAHIALTVKHAHILGAAAGARMELA